MTRPEDVLAIIGVLESKGFQVWLFGGWAVEAQISAARRPHEDVDLVVLACDLGRASKVIEALGFKGRPDPNDPCEHLRFGGCREGTVVQVACARIGREQAWFSVTSYPNRDKWLACPLDALPSEARGQLLGKALTCVTPEVLLQSKLSWRGRRQAERSDIPHLKRILSEGEVVRAEANCRPRLRRDCDADCDSDEGAG